MKQTTSHPDESGLAIGQEVRTSDGHPLGAVGNILKSHFEVAGPGDERFWLSKGTIASVLAEQVELNFAAGQIDDFRGEQPLANAESPVLDEAMETFTDEREQEARRRAQERGYEVTQTRTR